MSENLAREAAEKLYEEVMPMLWSPHHAEHAKRMIYEAFDSALAATTAPTAPAINPRRLNMKRKSETTKVGMALESVCDALKGLDPEVARRVLNAAMALVGPAPEPPRPKVTTEWTGVEQTRLRAAKPKRKVKR